MCTKGEGIKRRGVPRTTKQTDGAVPDELAVV